MEELEDILDEPPPPYHEAVRGWKLSYVDFAPKCLTAGGVLSRPNFERFNSLVSRANAWLRENPELGVRNCETIEMSCAGVKEGDALDTQATVHRFNASHRYRFRALRIWIVPRLETDVGGLEQLGYLNVLPACIKSGGIIDKPTFDTLDATIDKFNRLMRSRPLPGHVLSVDTMRVKFCEWRALPDPDACYWSEHSYFRTSFLRAIRIFYVSGIPAKEEIGWCDFDPHPVEGSTGPGGVLEPEYEGVEALMTRARSWLLEDSQMRITNIQTIPHKLRRGILKKKDSLFSETPLLNTWYVLGLRFYFVRQPQENVNDDSPVERVQLFSDLQYMTFFPREEVLQSILSRPEEETMQATVGDVNEWLNNHPDQHVLNVETLESQWSGTNSKNQGHANFLVNGIRVYSSTTCVDSLLRRGSQVNQAPLWVAPLSREETDEMIRQFLSVGDEEDGTDDQQPGPIDFRLRCRPGLFEPQDLQFDAPEYTPRAEHGGALDSDSDLDEQEMSRLGDPPQYYSSEPLQPATDSTTASDAPLIPEDSESEQECMAVAQPVQPPQPAKPPPVKPRTKKNVTKIKADFRPSEEQNKVAVDSKEKGAARDKAVVSSIATPTLATSQPCAVQAPQTNSTSTVYSSPAAENISGEIPDDFAQIPKPEMNKPDMNKTSNAIKPEHTVAEISSSKDDTDEKSAETEESVTDTSKEGESASSRTEINTSSHSELDLSTSINNQKSFQDQHKKNGTDSKQNICKPDEKSEDENKHTKENDSSKKVKETDEDKPEATPENTDENLCDSGKVPSETDSGNVPEGKTGPITSEADSENGQGKTEPDEKTGGSESDGQDKPNTSDLKTGVQQQSLLEDSLLTGEAMCASQKDQHSEVKEK